jgi:glutamine---fructose-6-phosphate transaminase (isomerizing)
MCGIVGYVGHRDALPVILSGLERLEYRGYDSAGVALYDGRNVEVTRAKGKLAVLKGVLSETPRTRVSPLGLGHTRWATHGKPSEANAHPHRAGRVSLIHNGIIENYMELRTELSQKGCVFSSETDTEVAAHLLNQELAEGHAPLAAFRHTCARLRGSYALLAIDEKNPDRVLVAKTATPIVIGIGEGETFVASDIPALLEHTRRFIILEDGDIAELNANSVEIYNNNQKVEREVRTITWDPVTAQKGGYKHYMLKEIFEQTVAVSDTLLGRQSEGHGKIVLEDLGLSPETICGINRIAIVACGTGWHAGLMAKFFIESIAKIPCEVDYASEFRYRAPPLKKDCLVLTISQSGETADTVAACELALKFSPVVAICNVLGSTLTRKTPHVLYTHAGPEISVASTKAFSTQLVAAYLFAIFLGQERGTLPTSEVEHHLQLLHNIPSALEEVFKTSSVIEGIAKTFHNAKDFLFLGRGTCYPIALEGALKLKEISYIHAEGYPAGEIKHGPIALVDEDMPIVVLLPSEDELFEKSLSNLREVESRGAKIIAITDRRGHQELRAHVQHVVEVPSISPLLTPLVMNIPLQFLAYYVAVHKGTDVDLPRNLAKSVTVE